MSRYLSANNKDGLKKVEYGDFPIEECISPNEFYDTMDSLEDGQTIYAAFGFDSIKLYQTLLEHYEVN